MVSRTNCGFTSNTTHATCGGRPGTDGFAGRPVKTGKLKTVESPPGWLPSPPENGGPPPGLLWDSMCLASLSHDFGQAADWKTPRSGSSISNSIECCCGIARPMPWKIDARREVCRHSAYWAAICRARSFESAAGAAGMRAPHAAANSLLKSRLLRMRLACKVPRRRSRAATVTSPIQ
jgi:hypothetical protein